LSDFNIFKLIAHYWGCGELFTEWTSPEAAFQILKRLSADQPFDITGIEDYKHLDDRGGIQWPLPATTSGDDWQNERRLFADGNFSTHEGKAKFLFDARPRVAKPTNEDFPFVMLTGRGTSAQCHTTPRTGKSAVPPTLYPANPYGEIHPADLSRLSLAANK